MFRCSTHLPRPVSEGCVGMSSKDALARAAEICVEVRDESPNDMRLGANECRRRILLELGLQLEYPEAIRVKSQSIKMGRKAIGELTKRQRQIMYLVLSGHPNKNIAADLGVSRRTVEAHRAAIMQRMGTKSLSALAQLVMAIFGDP